MVNNARKQEDGEESLPLVLKCDGLTFLTPKGYFEYITRKTGYPDYYKFFKEEYIKVEGVRLKLDILEMGKNVPTLIFLTDIALYPMCYAELLYKLGKKGFNIIGLNYRGHGMSEGVRGDFTVTRMLLDIIDTISYAKERFNGAVSLVGSAMGGVLALYTATLAPPLASVLCHNIADLSAPETLKLMKYPKAVEVLKTLAFKFGNPDMQVPYTSHLDDFEKLEVKYFGTAKKFIETDPMVLKSFSLRAIKSLATTSPPEPIKGMKTPVMVIAGTAEQVFSIDYTQKMFDRLTCPKKLQFFMGLNQFMMIEQADAVIPPMVKWLKKVQAKTGVVPLKKIKESRK